MPNIRAEGQKLLTLPASAEFIRTIDKNLAACGYSNRSQFIRDAIVEKLKKSAVRVPKGLELAPMRTPETSNVVQEETTSASPAHDPKKPGIIMPIHSPKRVMEVMDKPPGYAKPVRSKVRPGSTVSAANSAPPSGVAKLVEQTASFGKGKNG